MWVLCDREPVKDWSQGRVTLLGDAAHPMLQYLAQGAAMATEDAVRLADEVAQPHDLPAAFRAYVQQRYLRTARVQIMARVYGDFYSCPRAGGRAAQSDAGRAHPGAVIRRHFLALWRQLREVPTATPRSRAPRR